MSTTLNPDTVPQTPANYRSLHFSRKHRIVAALSRRVRFTYTIRHGLAAGMRRRGGLGFLPWAGAETAELKFFRQLALEDAVVYDVGAFEGILTLFFSSRARRVISYEPNPESRARLATNLALNGISNVTVRDVGLSDAPRETTLVFDPLMPGAASGAVGVGGQIRDCAPKTTSVPVRCTRLDDEVFTSGQPAPDFLKIDVEGMEAEVLRGGRRTLEQFHPRLYIEMHGADEPDKRRIAAEVLALLKEFGYGEIVDIERGVRVDAGYSFLPGHLFCLR